MSEFSIPVRIYIEDTDAGGIVYYVNYLKYMERARTEFMRSLGYGKAAILNNSTGDAHVMFVVSSSNVHYFVSAVLDDELLVTAQPVKVGRASIVFEQAVIRAGKILCKGEIKIACVDRRSATPQAMPVAMYDQVNSIVK
jgi:4-hydroxybenzoyl-CoA thioesterase/acyl-CoA thioester hydrolase